MYCTYLTIYLGNKLPPFYIGYSLIEKIKKGYHGSVASQQYKTVWRQELKNHPEFFKTTILTIHETKEHAREREMSLQRAMNVIKNPMYINLSIYPQVIGGFKGKKHSEETKKKMSEAQRGRIITKEHRAKISKTLSNGMVSGSNNPMYGRKRPDNIIRNKQRLWIKSNDHQLEHLH